MHFYKHSFADWQVFCAGMMPLEALIFQKLFCVRVVTGRLTAEKNRLLRASGLLDVFTPEANLEVEKAFDSLVKRYFQVVDGHLENDFFNKILSEYKENETKQKARTEGATAARQRNGNVTTTLRKRNDDRNVVQNKEYRIKNLDIYPPTPLEGGACVSLDADAEEVKQVRRKGGGLVNVDCPDGLAPQVWADFTASRRSVNKTMLDEIDKQAAIANLTLAKAIETMVQRGWKNFEANWVIAERNKTEAANADLDQQKKERDAVRPDGVPSLRTSPLSIFKPEPSAVRKFPVVEGQLTDADCPTDLSPKIFSKFLGFRKSNGMATTYATLDALKAKARAADSHDEYSMLVMRNTAIAELTI